MATRIVTFEETKDSRDGSARGVSGVTEIRKFNLILDIDAEDFTELRYPDVRGFVESQIPLGSPHPWNAFSFAADYLAINRVSAQRWLVGVVYKPAHGLSDMPLTPEGTPWRPVVRGVSFQRQILETFRDPDRPLEGPKLIATSHFEKIVGAGPAQFVATIFERSADGNSIVERTVGLQKTQMLNRQPQTTDDGGLTAAWTRTIQQFDFANMAAINDMWKGVNRRTFLGAPRGHVKFDVFSLDPIDAYLPGQRNAGQHWRVVVGFTMSKLPYAPTGFHPTITDDLGNEAPVRHAGPGGLLVMEEFLAVRLVSFGPLFQIFGALPT